MGNTQRRQPPIFKDPLVGQRPSASEQKKLIDAVRQIMSQSSPYSIKDNPEVINITAWDATRELYTGTIQYNSNPVHISNAVSGAVTFEDTDPVIEKKEIADPGHLLYEGFQVGKLVIARPHEQSGYYLAVANLAPYIIDVKVSSAGSIAFGASGTVDVWRAGVVTDPLETFTMTFRHVGVGRTLEVGTAVKCYWDSSDRKMVVLTADCP